MITTYYVYYRKRVGEDLDVVSFAIAVASKDGVFDRPTESSWNMDFRGLIAFFRLGI